MFYSSSFRFLANRSPAVAATSSARPRDALDCSVPVFGNSFAPAFLVDGFTTGVIAGSLVSAFGSFLSASLRGSLTVTLTGTSSLEPSG